MDWTELKYMIGILVAVVLGFAIGYERKMRFKEAGIRTHTIVCVGSVFWARASSYTGGRKYMGLRRLLEYGRRRVWEWRREPACMRWL